VRQQPGNAAAVQVLARLLTWEGRPGPAMRLLEAFARRPATTAADRKAALAEASRLALEGGKLADADRLLTLRLAADPGADALILGAQTENNLIVAERGVMWAKITTRGRAAHAGNPAAGDNAILRMMRLVGALSSYYDKALAKRISGAMKSTVNIGMFHGGHNTNVVPSACTVEIDRRLLPDEKVKDAFKELKQVIDGVGEPRSQYKVEFLTGTNGFFAPENGAAVGAFEAAVKKQTGRKVKFLNATGVSDGRYYADDGIEIINFGPGSGAQGHAANESVPIAEMVEAAEIQMDVVKRLLG